MIHKKNKIIIIWATITTCHIFYATQEPVATTATTEPKKEAQQIAQNLLTVLESEAVGNLFQKNMQDIATRFATDLNATLNNEQKIVVHALLSQIGDLCSFMVEQLPNINLQKPSPEFSQKLSQHVIAIAVTLIPFMQPAAEMLQKNPGGKIHQEKILNMFTNIANRTAEIFKQ